MKTMNRPVDVNDVGHNAEMFYVNKSWFGLAVAFALWVATDYLALPVMSALGSPQPEGNLVLMAHNFTGVVVFAVMLLLVALPLTYGLIWGYRALMEERRLGSVMAFTINLVAVLVLLYMAVDQVLMSYWPGIRGE